MAADTVGGILLAAVTLYAVLGGADFGAGLWDLLAGGDRRGRAPRQLIDTAITPVWEANHVWLVFILVIFWTAFPQAFAAVMNAAALPLWLALAGIVLRGSGFAFRKEVHRLDVQRILGATFAFSSLVTPFFMGTVIGAIATGGIPADASHAILSAWTSPTALLAGFLFVGACGYLAAVYLVGEAARDGNRRLAAYFARRAQAAGVMAGALSLAALAELHTSNRFLFDRLTGRALPLVVAAGVCGVAVVVLLATPLTASRRWEGTIRAIAALGVAAVVWGLGVAQYPVLLPGTSVTLGNAGAPHATLVALVVLFVVVLLLIGPSFGLLFALAGRRLLRADESAPLGASLGAGAAAPSTRRGPGSAGRQPPILRAAAFTLAVAVALLRRRQNH
ncbi:MAG: cytochrome d ubiquinol oxidase subunit II [Streptosporangiaceae bacterium]|nr:cytochrome d ubiquinol oxidase subunit II [Streptosporangiaceae bacterium]